MTGQIDAREEMLEQAGQVVMSGRAAALVASDHEALSALLGQLAMGLIEFGGEIVRLDAMVSHERADVSRALADSLQVPESELGAVLQLRGDTSNPLLLLVDNAECLSTGALRKLGELLSLTGGGLGLALAGEPELEDLLDESGLPVELVFDADDLAVPMLEPEDGSDGETLVLPWKHISAIVGLLLLIWLLWPREHGADPEVQPLALPEPVTLPEVVAEPDGADESALAPSPAAPRAVAPETLPEPVVVEPVAPEPVAPPPRPEAPAPAKSAPVEQKSEPPLTGLAAELGYRQEDWLLAANAGHWVLQVALGSSEDAARRVLDRLGKRRGAYYRARRNGEEVYIVLAGTWPDREQALQARASLPPELRDRGPFPREVAQIQSEIRASLR